MTGIALAYGGNKRTVGRFPEIVQRNLFAEAAPSEVEKGFALIARPGLEGFATQPAANGRGIFQRTGLWGSDALFLSGTTLSRLSDGGVVTPFSGDIPGTGRVRIAAGRNDAGDDIARIATGDGLYLADDTTVMPEDFPEAGGAGAQDVESHRDFWFALEAGSEKFYVKLPGDATTWDPLEYASNEYKPDRGVACRSLGDQIWFLNGESAEAWGLTGDLEIVAPLGGMNFDKGCLNRDTAISSGGRLSWVDHEFSVQLTVGGEPQTISDNGLSEEIRRSDPEALRAWSFTLDQHPFNALTLGERGTWCFDFSTKLWHPWTSQGYDFWRATLGCNLAGRVIALDAVGTDIWRLSTDRYFDDDAEIDCTFTCLAPISEGALSCDNFTVHCATGWAPVEGAGSDPKVAMRYSDDGGFRWSDWRERSLGTRGQYGVVVKWNGLGEIRAPHGRVFQVRSTDGTVRRFSNPRINV